MVEGIDERFGAQVVQMLGAAEHRSERISSMRERGAEAATTQMGRMGAEDPSTPPPTAY
jgi:hypothetical protein